MHSKIQKIVDDVPRLADSWGLLVERWGKSGLPEDTPYARLHGATFKEFNKRVITTLELVASLGRVDDAGQLIFLPKADTVTKQLQVARTNVAQLFTELNAQPQANFRDASSNLDSVQGFVNGSHVCNANAGALLDQISAAMATLFDVASAGFKFGKGKGLSIYLNYGEQLQVLASDVRKLHAEVTSSRNAAAALVDEAKESAAKAAEYSGAADEANDKTAETLTATKETLLEADAKLAAIRETAKAASSLATQVEGYEASFDAFQKSLDDRVAQHTEFEKNISEALIANKAREDEIDRLTVKANSMIQGATTAGLGDSLERTRKLYQGRMFGAGLCFFVSVLLLAASAIPLVAHVLPGLFTNWLPIAPATTSINSVQPVGSGEALLGLLGKIFLMFPATWLTQFFSKAYSEFFHLEREYAHKAALAQSVEGFKKQAPKYEEEITTAVFFEVQSNPSKQKAPDAAEHPIMGPLMRKFIDALPMGKPDTGNAK